MVLLWKLDIPDYSDYFVSSDLSTHTGASEGLISDSFVAPVSISGSIPLKTIYGTQIFKMSVIVNSASTFINKQANKFLSCQEGFQA